MNGHIDIRTLTDYLLNRLSPEEETRVQEHLSSCPECAGKLEGMRRLRQGFFGEEEEIKEGELEELQREIDDLTRQRDEEERELKQIIERLKSLRDKREAQEAQNDGLREELANADDIDQEISEKEPKLREARDQVARKRRAFEEERAALLELMKQMNPT